MRCLHGHRAGTCRVCHPPSEELRAVMLEVLVLAEEERLRAEKLVPDGVGVGFVVFSLADEN